MSFICQHLSCEAETCRRGSLSGELGGNAPNWSGTGRLASNGLDRGPRSFSS
jgi:hypothetical protein